MSARFVAVPVDWGDAFYLDSGEVTLLVDGGLDDAALPGLLRRYAQPNREHPSIDIVICTHNDADHACGLLGLLRDQHAHVGEMWLPGTFRDALRRVAGVGVAAGVLSAIGGPHGPLPASDPADGQDFLDRTARAENEPRQITDDDVDIAPVLGEWTRTRGYWCDTVAPRLAWAARGGAPGPRQLVEALRNILDLAEACATRGVPVRWLELDERGPCFESRGVRAVRAIDARIAARRRAMLPDVLYLSLVNRNALTFIARPPCAEWVLFSSDAGSQFVAAPPGIGVITAPHHGSADRENERAYSSFQPVSTAWLVRSDGSGPRARSRPGPAFRAWPRHQRFCTRCRNRARAQAVELATDANGSWKPVAPTRACRC